MRQISPIEWPDTSGSLAASTRIAEGLDPLGDVSMTADEEEDDEDDLDDEDGDDEDDEFDDDDDEEESDDDEEEGEPS